MRSTHKKEPKKIYQIFCEGESEENYFLYLGKQLGKSIHCHKLQHKDFKGIIKEIRDAVNLKGLKKKEVFCIIDKDEHNIQECQDNNSRLLKYAELIFSSKSFEVWILMHPSKFEKEVQSVQEYKKILNSGSNKQFFTKNGFNGEIRKPYSDEKLLNILYNNTQKAIDNAEYVSNKQLEENGNNKFKCEPYSDMGKLIKEIVFN